MNLTNLSTAYVSNYAGRSNNNNRNQSPLDNSMKPEGVVSDFKGMYNTFNYGGQAKFNSLRSRDHSIETDNDSLKRTIKRY